VFTNNGSGASTVYLNADNSKIYNSTFAKNSGIGLKFGTATGCEAKNNIFWSNGTNAITGGTNDYNAYENTTAVANNVNLGISDPFITSTTYSGPDYVGKKAESDAANWNLISGCPAINTGADLFASGVSTDLIGNARPTGAGAVDMGAYEYGFTTAQSISFGALSSKTYGDGTSTLSATGGESGNPVVFTSSNTNVATCTGTNGTTLTVVSGGSCTIYANQASSGTYSAATQVGQKLIVYPKPLTAVSNSPAFAATSKQYDGTTAAVITGGGTFTGIVGSDVVSLSTGTFGNAAIGSRGVTVSAILSGAQAANYYYSGTIPTVSAVNITARPLTITASNVNKTYGTTQSSPVSGSTAFTSSGLQNGETIGSVTLTYGVGALTATSAAGSISTITPSAAIAGTFTAGNYSITYTAGTLTVAQKALSITAPTIASKVYNGTATSGTVTTGTLSGFVSGETVTVSSAAGTYLNANVGTGKTATIVYTLANGTGGGLAANYSLANGSATGNITAAPLTISGISGVNKVYNGTNTATLTGTAAYNGLVNSEVFSVTGTPSANFADATVGNGKSITVTGYTAPSGNYTVSQPGGLTANITSATLTLNSGIYLSDGYPALQLANSDIIISSGAEFQLNQQTADVQSVTVAPGSKLTLGSNSLNATNGIILQSDATGTGTLMDSYTEPTISATVKQYVTAGRNWYISAPLNNSAAYSVLNKGASVVEYNEASGLWVDKTSGTLTRGKGYIQVATSSQGSTGTVDFTGTTNSGNVEIALTNNSGGGKGFNLVGNPYPSYLNWSEVANDLDNTDNLTGAKMPTGTMWYRTISYNGKSAWSPTTAYILDDVVYNGTRFYKVTTAGTSAASVGPTGTTTSNDGSVVWAYQGSIYIFATVNEDGQVSPATVSNLIPPMQAFWVKSSGGTLTFKNSMRSHESGSNLLKAPKVSDTKLVRLRVSNGASVDESVIYASANALNTFDSYDAPKYFNTSSNQPEIYSQVGSEKLTINAMNEMSIGTEIRLGFLTEKANEFSISASEIKNFDSNVLIILKDKLQNSEFNLTDGGTYNFSSDVANNTDRFSIIFRSPGAVTGVGNPHDNNILVYSTANQQLKVLNNNNSGSLVTVCNAIGQKLISFEMSGNSMVIDKTFNPGVYFVTVTAPGMKTTKKVVIN